MSNSVKKQNEKFWSKSKRREEFERETELLNQISQESDSTAAFIKYLKESGQIPEDD